MQNIKILPGLVSLIASAAVFGGSFVQPAVAETEDWRTDLFETIESCQEPLIFDQYANEDYKISFFRDTEYNVIYCGENLQTGEKVKLTGEFATDYEYSEHKDDGIIYYTAFNGSYAYSLVVKEPGDDDDFYSYVPEIYLQVTDGEELLYLEEVTATPAFDIYSE